ncbi:S8 family serine peptidase [Nocardia yamanashiensis]|uniref:S8 family peptidase n=1 Tax=Nocardia yamanashiensis TaxID=209247 RepID=UPI001E5038BD|nr:S8 family peptidase [Nocardia yamanashiensis]UGT45143.1 S8 family serine peptidase [Nocardia yamanashiensis]
MTEHTARIVVKLRADAPPPARGSRLNDLRLENYFDPRVLAPLPPGHGGPERPLDRYRRIEVRDRDTALALAEELAADPAVETAYVEGGPTPPPVHPADDPRNAAQHYLDAAPAGIDARWAWQQSITGAGVACVDLEQGWTLNHEDLVAANISLLSGVNTAYHGHGTAVLGELGAVDNTVGGVGIAPHATFSVVSQYRAGGAYSTAEAIVSVSNVLVPGSVLLLEAQTVYSTSGSSYVPVEVEEAVFDAIRAACDKGLVVVEAAGNGSYDLDTFTDTKGKTVLKRGSADFKDSGAIMVGAASSAVPHRRLGFSNFGSRVDCFGWGEHIDTTGDGWMSRRTDDYTTDFGGTSGASPIVAGAAVLIQSSTNIRADSEYMRALLTTWGTASADPATDRIGVMPDVRRTIQGLHNHLLRPEIHAALEFILFGIINDAPGVVLGPDGPRPVDPGWGARWITVNAHLRRQILTDLAQQLEALPQLHR